MDPTWGLRGAQIHGVCKALQGSDVEDDQEGRNRERQRVGSAAEVPPKKIFRSTNFDLDQLVPHVWPHHKGAATDLQATASAADPLGFR